MDTNTRRAYTGRLSNSEIMEIAKQQWRPRVSLDLVAKAKSKEARAKKQGGPSADSPLNVRKLIMIVATVPFRTVSEYYQLCLGLNPRSGNEAKNRAVKEGLLIQHNLHTGRRGGNIALLEPTEKAFAMLKLPPRFGNPGFRHCYLQTKSAEAVVAMGYKAYLEKAVKGKRIDVVAVLDKKSYAIECAATEKHEVVNVRKDIFRAGFNKVVIVAIDRKVATKVNKKIKQAFGSDVLSKVQVCILSELEDGKVL
jgi:hypothetical protein